MIVPLALIILAVVVFVALGVKVIEEHEQGLLTRLGRHLRVLDPGLHLILPFVDQMERIDLREVAVVKPVEPGGVGRIRIGSEEREARTDDRERIGPGTPVRIARVERQVIVVTAGPQA